MNLILDTCCLIWLATDPTKFSPRALSLLHNPTTRRFLSVVSVWEIAVKINIGKLTLNDDLGHIVAEQMTLNQLSLLPLQLDHALAGHPLPLLHKDPFDRLLICQAMIEGATILTPDRLIRQYPIPTEW